MLDYSSVLLLFLIAFVTVVTFIAWPAATHPERWVGGPQGQYVAIQHRPNGKKTALQIKDMTVFVARDSREMQLLSLQELSSQPPANAKKGFLVTVDKFARSAGIATIMTPQPHKLSTGDKVDIKVFYPSDGTFDAKNVSVTVKDEKTFTYANAGSDWGSTQGGGEVMYGDILMKSVAWVSRTANITTIKTDMYHYLKTGQIVSISIDNLPSFDVTNAAVTVVDELQFTYTNPGPDMASTSVQGLVFTTGQSEKLYRNTKSMCSLFEQTLPMFACDSWNGCRAIPCTNYPETAYGKPYTQRMHFRPKMTTQLIETTANTDTEYIRWNLLETFAISRVVIYAQPKPENGLSECDLQVLDRNKQLVKSIPFPTTPQESYVFGF